MSSPSDTSESDLPAVDDRVVEAGSRYEIDDGKLVYVPPAKEPHAVAHTALGALLLAHRAPGYSVALDMLTRVTQDSDIAPDAAIYPSGRDPQTGGRQLEELAFEILDTSRLSAVGQRAMKLVNRGVRRVFGIDVAKKRVVEWSCDLAGWSILHASEPIVDRTLAVPLPLAPLVNAALAIDAVVHAYREQRHPEFIAEREEGREEGRAESLRTVLRGQLEQKFGPLSSARATTIGAATTDELDGWLRRVLSASTLDEVFA